MMTGAGEENKRSLKMAHDIWERRSGREIVLRIHDCVPVNLERVEELLFSSWRWSENRPYLQVSGGHSIRHSPMNENEKTTSSL